MEVPTHDDSEQTTPASVFIEDVTAIREQLRELGAEHSELQTRLSQNERTKETTQAGYEKTVATFFESLGQADPLYRSLFEIELSKRPSLLDWSEAVYLQTRVGEFDKTALALIAFRTFLGSITVPTPLLNFRTHNFDLVSNPRGYTNPSERDLERTRMWGITAELMTIEPGTELTIDSQVSYSPLTGQTQTAKGVSVLGKNVTYIHTSSGGFDYDTWLNEPIVSTREEQVLPLLGKAATISTLSYDSEIIDFHKAEGTVLVGRRMIAHKLETFGRNADQRALEALRLAYDSLDWPSSGRGADDPQDTRES